MLVLDDVIDNVCVVRSSVFYQHVRISAFYQHLCYYKKGERQN